MRGIAVATYALVALTATGGGGRAGDCPRSSDAIGTSRELVIDPARYRGAEAIESLPLGDHELVITFDDGPRRSATDKVLDVLRAQCVKATFFVRGDMARNAPELVARTYAEGHTIGTHTESHPHLTALSYPEATRNIEQGIADTAAALGERDQVSPFFRAPYLEISSPIEGYLDALGIMAWSADFMVDDWSDMTGDQMVALALDRIEARGRGVLLMHDVMRPTVEGLPRLLRELHRRGYRIVHAVPAGPTAANAASRTIPMPPIPR